jgi:serine/threonine protein kinase
MWYSILGLGASCFATCTDGKTVLKGYEVWEDGKLRASYPRRCEEALAHEAHVYEHLRPHPQILTCFGLEEVHPGVHALQLELAALGNVRQYMDGHREYPPAAGSRLQMALDVARGISHIHSRGVQHADLSCRNFFLFDEFRVKIGDFGASVINGDDSFMESPVCEEARYELPCRGRDFDDRPVRKRELFALGSAIYEIMAWRRPYEDLEDTEVEKRFAHEEFPPLGDLTVGRVISNCWMEVYNSADEVALDLCKTWKDATGGNDFTTNV